MRISNAARKMLKRQGVLDGLPAPQGWKEESMPLTKDFRDTIRERAQQEPAFRRALLQEAIELMLTGDVTTGKALIRNYVNATVGFQELARAVDTPAPSLMRMFGPKGNPSAKNLFNVIAHLQKQEGVHLALCALTPPSKRAPVRVT